MFQCYHNLLLKIYRKKKKIELTEYLILCFVQHNEKTFLPSICNDGDLHFKIRKKIC